MNILIPHSWLLDFLETKATSQQIADSLSLCSCSVERIHKMSDKDSVYEIEVTTNRPDMLSVIGIAREAAAVLPRFKIKAALKNLSLIHYRATEYGSKQPKTTSPSKEEKLKVIIKNPYLCSRFSAVILSNVVIKPSSSLIKERLKKVNIRPINNIVDISNYLMIEFGQPVHTFDYDKISGRKMIMRESKPKEKIITLDGKTHILPGGDIVIEDAENQLIDLCGIMGGKNTAISSSTKNVLLFVQNYNPEKIRKTTMSLGIRTEASTRFEKGLDSEIVQPAIFKGIQMFKNLAAAKSVSKIIDIYQNPYKLKNIKISHQFLETRLGIKINSDEVKKILNSLHFHTSYNIDNTSSIVSIPSWRSHDISLPEDIVEEVSRIYGYHNLPSILMKGEIPSITQNPKFNRENKVKNMLKYWGFTEIMTYSLISKNLLENCGLDPQSHLKLKNPLTTELVYLRQSLLPSMLQIVSQNEGNYKNSLKFFEIANVYLPSKPGYLPKEITHLAAAVYHCKKNREKKVIKRQAAASQLIPAEQKCFLKAKGYLEALLSEMGIIQANTFNNSRMPLYEHISLVPQEILNKFNISHPLAVFEINFDEIVNSAAITKTYTPIPKYPPIIEDLTIAVKSGVFCENIVKTIKNQSPLIKKVETIDIYKNKYTFRIYYQHPKRNLTSKEVKALRERIMKKLMFASSLSSS